MGNMVYINPARSLSKYGLNIFICLIVQAAAGFLVSQIYLLSKNTLKDNGSWISTKTTMEMGLIGAFNYFEKRQALARCRLDLSAWHGYQEVIYRDPVELGQIEFEYLLSEGAYLYCIFNKDKEGFSGLRISLNKSFKNIYFRAKNCGEFIEQAEIRVAHIEPGTWNNCRIVFNGDRFTYYMNGSETGSIYEGMKAARFFGFRGGSKRALVDNIIVKEINGNIIREDFCNRNNKNIIMISVFLIICLTDILVFLNGKFGERHGKNIGLVLTWSFAALLIAAVFIITDYYVLVSRYPKPEGIFGIRKKIDERYIRKEIERINMDLRERIGKTDENIE